MIEFIIILSVLGATAYGFYHIGYCDGRVDEVQNQLEKIDEKETV